MIQRLIANGLTSSVRAKQAADSRDVPWMLTHAVRFFTLQQIAQVRFSDCKDPPEMARQYVRRLERKHGLLSVRPMMLSPMLPLDEPLHVHNPGDPMPDCDALAWKAQSRWRLAPLSTLVITASANARQHYQDSLPARRMRQTDATHDAHCSQLYINLLQADPERAATWIPEDRLYQAGHHNFGQRIPDAIVIDPTPTVFEFCGRYPAKKLRAYYQEFSDYQYLWF